MPKKSEIQSKIETYNDFIEDKLKEDLKHTQIALEKLHEEKQNWMDAKLNFKMLRTFKEKCPQQDLCMDIPLAEWGNKSITASTIITDVEKVHVDIGCGVRLTMELDHADKYADIRLKLIEKQIEHYMDMAVQIKVHIKVTLLAVNELIESEKKKT